MFIPLKRLLVVALLVSAILVPGCRRKPIEERTFSVRGVVQSITSEELVVETRQGIRRFVMGPASIKGGDFGAGTEVAVYYLRKGDIEEVTMVVRRVQ